MLIEHIGFQPRFLTKEERAKLAIEKRTQEIREQKTKEEDKRRERETLEREADQLRHREQERYGGSSGGRQGGGRCEYSLPEDTSSPFNLLYYDLFQMMIDMAEEEEVAETTIGNENDHLQTPPPVRVLSRVAAYQLDPELIALKTLQLPHHPLSMVPPQQLQALWTVIPLPLAQRLMHLSSLP